MQPRWFAFFVLFGTLCLGAEGAPFFDNIRDGLKSFGETLTGWRATTTTSTPPPPATLEGDGKTLIDAPRRTCGEGEMMDRQGRCRPVFRPA